MAHPIPPPNDQQMMTEQAHSSSGAVIGRRKGKVIAFLGIPYGADPSGNRRFKPAAPANPWTGIRDATKWGPRCYQSMAPNPLALAFPKTFEAIAGEDRQPMSPMREDSSR